MPVKAAAKKGSAANVREGLPDKSRVVKKAKAPASKANKIVREGLPDKSRSAKKAGAQASKPVREGVPDKSRGATKKR